MLKIELFDKITHQIQHDPNSGQSLLLFALIKTLDTPKGGHLYLLKKLTDFSADNRKLAYGLMELLATGENHGSDWDNLIATLETTFKSL